MKYLGSSNDHDVSALRRPPYQYDQIHLLRRVTKGKRGRIDSIIQSPIQLTVIKMTMHQNIVWMLGSKVYVRWKNYVWSLRIDAFNKHNHSQFLNARYLTGCLHLSVVFVIAYRLVLKTEIHYGIWCWSLLALEWTPIFTSQPIVFSLLTCAPRRSIVIQFFGQPGSVSKFQPFLWVKLWVGWVGRAYTEISRYFPASWINWVTLVRKIKLLYSLRF